MRREMCRAHWVPLIHGVCPECEGPAGRRKRDGMEAVLLVLLGLVLLTVVVVLAWLL